MTRNEHLDSSNCAATQSQMVIEFAFHICAQFSNPEAS